MLARSVAEYNSSAGAASAGRGVQFLLTVRDGFGNDILDMARPSLPAYCAVPTPRACGPRACGRHDAALSVPSPVLPTSPLSLWEILEFTGEIHRGKFVAVWAHTAARHCEFLHLDSLPTI